MAKPRRGRKNPSTAGDDGDSEICSRCSPLYFYNAIEELREKISHNQWLAIKNTPFAPYFDMPKIGGSFARVQCILRRFQMRTTSVVVGDDIAIPFTAEEFGIVMGLQHVGQPVDLELKMGSDMVERLFEGKFHNVSRSEIYTKLLEFADKHGEKDVDDFVRLYILLVFNCILFPMSNYSTPRFLLPYVDDLDGFSMYAWGDAVYQFLLGEMKNHLEGDSGKRYFDGCAIGLMAWMHEHIPSLGSPNSLRSFPRFFRWGESKIPTIIKLANEMFQEISRDKVFPIQPFPEERRLLTLIQEPVEKVSTDVAALEIKLSEKEREIGKLKEKIIFLEKQAKFEARKKAKSAVEFVEEGLVDIEVRWDEFDTSKVCEDQNYAYDDNFNAPDFDGKDAGGNLSEKEKEVEGEKETGDQMTVNETDKDEDEIEEDAQKSARDKEDKSKNEEVGVINLLSSEKKAAPEKGKSTNEEVGVINLLSSEKKAAPEDDSISSPRLEEAALLDNLISSIVMDVQGRQDRTKKRKNEDFITPPGSTTPQKKQKVATRKSKKMIEETATVSADSSLELYRRREDFKGHTEVSEKERRFIQTFLAKDDLGVIVWKGADLLIYGDVLCTLLFGDQLRSDLVDCYMRILCSPSYREKYGHGIWSMDTVVMFEILSHLEKRNKKRVLKLDEFDSFLGTMMVSARKMLEKLNLDVLNSNRFIIMPLNSKTHWYLLVFDTVEKKFTHMNSMWGSQSKGTAKVFAKFISGFLFHSYGYETEKPDVYCRKSQQQTGSTDCGVYVCLWAEAFAQNTKEYWAYADNCVIDGHRAKIAATILGHEGGLLYKEVN